MLPKSLADSIADNLIQNALSKRAMDPRVRVSVRLEYGGSFQFSVTDTGRAIPIEIERELFRVPVPSNAGLGIGLYNAARHAEANGFLLSLVRNLDGEVCFSLSRRIDSTPTAGDGV